MKLCHKYNKLEQLKAFVLLFWMGTLIRQLKFPKKIKDHDADYDHTWHTEQRLFPIWTAAGFRAKSESQRRKSSYSSQMVFI